MAKRAKTGRINDEFAKTLALNVIILAPGAVMVAELRRQFSRPLLEEART